MTDKQIPLQKHLNIVSDLKLKLDEARCERDEALTKREYFAAAALSAMIQKTPKLERISFSNGRVKGSPDDVFNTHMEGVARAAVEYADALLLALERKPE
jgi:predicted metal-dependent hydrolase